MSQESQKPYEFENFTYLSENESILLKFAGESILGIPIEYLGSKYTKEIDSYLSTLPEWLRKEYKLIFKISNLKLTGFVYTKRFKNFTKLSKQQRQKFIKTFSTSRIPLLRSAFFGLKSICAWGYYSQDNSIQDYPGNTIGREHETPTLLFGKHPWRSSDQS